jgi:beta-xylosidase
VFAVLVFPFQYHQNDQNYVTVWKGPHGDDGKTLWVARCKAGKLESPAMVVYNEPGVDLRMLVTGAKVQGFYRASSTDKWRSIGEVEMPDSGAAKVGFRTGNGELKQSWARFSKLRMLQLE